MKLSHKIKLFLAKRRGQVNNIKPVVENWQLPTVKPEIVIPKPVLKQPVNSTQTLREFISARKLFLEENINLVIDQSEKQIMDEEYQQLEKIEEVLWPLIKG